ncbi:MAG: 3-deoxy-manno-octulosonate cytidylyltransferase [Paludibacteraceae bacterium]|nr:3-deoxy-manno-octulosonate cytidylyltransferase [Paludibacteraceae bacterium]MBQ2190401.1 3-deoxy-manno-octulosonate cytidylyltransferase [Paludibacteraceae bacterium]MBQ2520469.1 3-deoxy-manno-octulosonate cytidylyltransferase [Paludibacteraceae bacterium]MBQ5378920.1 3-deoxy-manno-octulosonate cytidylyltransferase [Paludibacteraceae bacterium]
MKYFGIIPARYGSSRFPGKPLADLCHKSVIHRVYEQASKAIDTVVVATDDERIYDAVESFGGKVVMTRADHKCGTDRCLEAYLAITTPSWREQNDTDTVIVNIQGDEPFIQPEQIETLLRCFDREDTQIATLVRPFTDKDSQADLENVNTPKVNWDKATGEAKMFSREVIACADGTHYRHIGIYAYRADVLAQITQLPQSPLEIKERLEQLRWLENGYKIRVGVTNIQTIGIDTPEDLEKAIEWYKWNG